MPVVLIVLGLVIVIFGSVVFWGAPYLPTLNSQIEAAFALADIKAGQSLLELGCGDGRVLVAAAQHGVTAIGIELNPILVIIAKFKTRQYKALIKVKWGNYWWSKWPKTDVIFVFLINKYMLKLHNKIIQSKLRPVKLVSVAFSIPNQPAAAHKAGVYLYNYK